MALKKNNDYINVINSTKKKYRLENSDRQKTHKTENSKNIISQ